MQVGRILAFVWAGGDGGRHGAIGTRVPKPALPFAGRRVIDFALSNLVNSGVVAMYVLARHDSRAIVEHVESVWSPMLRRLGGFAAMALPKDGGTPGFLGTVDALRKNVALIERHRPDRVAIFAGDQVCRMDVAQMAAFHAVSGAAITVAGLPVPSRLGRLWGAMLAAESGKVAGLAGTAPAAATRDCRVYASMNDYIFDADALLALLTQPHFPEESDVGRHTLPRALRTHAVYAYDFSRNRVPGLLDCEEACYWRDFRTLDAYVAAQDDTLGPWPRFNVENPLWPIYGGRVQAPSELRDAA